MKKLIVSLVAIAVIAAVVGSCFAVYSISDSRSASIGVDASSVTLAINGVDANFTISNLQPNHGEGVGAYTGIEQQVTLTTNNNVSLIENGAQGTFTVTIAATDSENAKDVALASAIVLSATDANSGNYTATQLTNGVVINLKTIPQYFTLKYSLPEESQAFNFMSVAEGSVTVTLSWEKVDFAIDANAYYLIGTINGKEAWAITPNAYKLGAGTGTNIAEIDNVYFNAGDVIKAHKETDNVWLGGKTNNTESGKVSVSEDNGNVTINTAGHYNVFINEEYRVWLSYVGE